VSVLKCMEQKDGISGPAAAIQSLNKYLDTYYSDAEAWQELASLYLSQNLYSQAAFALEELILLAPSNTFFVLQYAEVLATMDDLPLAYKQYLRVLEMCGTEALEADSQHPNRQGPWARALWGLKSVTTKLIQRQRQTISSTQKGAAGKGSNNAKSTTSIGDEKVEKVEAVDAMVTDLLLNKAYAGANPGLKATRDAARKVLSA
jgi:ER membrane protein complex subunit 2